MTNKIPNELLGQYDVPIGFINELRKLDMVEDPDPHMPAALEVAAESLRQNGHNGLANAIERGDGDKFLSVQAALAGIKHGLVMRPELTLGMVEGACFSVSLDVFEQEGRDTIARFLHPHLLEQMK